MSAATHRSTDNAHGADGSITASEQKRRHQEWLDQVESTVLCAFCPGWSFTGPAIEARAAASLHREEQHPGLGNSKRRTVRRECKVPGCVKWCKPGSDRCWDHADQHAVKAEAADGRELLDRMDAGLPLLDQIEAERQAVLGEAEPQAEAANRSDEPEHSHTASTTPGRTGRSPSASPNTDERTRMECKIDGCDGDASGAPKAGSHARLCEHHREIRSAEMSAARRGRPRGDVAARKAVRPPPTGSRERVARLESGTAARGGARGRRLRNTARARARGAEAGRGGAHLT